MAELSRGRSALVLLLAVGLCFATAAIGGLSTADGVREWYPSLDKPPWTPPDWVFGPVWTTLYTTMAVAVWDVVRRSGLDDAKGAAGLWLVQLALNLLWSPLFFRWHLLGVALLEIALLWLAVAGCVVVFWRHSRVASVLMAPYLAWITLASSLNAWIWWNNP